MVLRYCFGMMASVSTLTRGIGAATPVSFVNLSMVDPRSAPRSGGLDHARAGLDDIHLGGGVVNATPAGRHEEGAEDRDDRDRDQEVQHHADQQERAERAEEV